MSWQPLHPVHSIENASAAINFVEPLTDVVWRKAVREAEVKSNANGLTVRNTVNSLQIAIGPGAQLPIPQHGLLQPTAVGSVQFTRSITDERSNQPIAAETVTIGKSGLIYYTTVYTRWHAFAERLRSMLTDPLAIALGAVRVSSLRLEYKDAFRFVGDGPPLAADLLRGGSNLIVPQVYDQPELWHSHTGFFETAQNCDQRLVQVHIDANEVIEIGETTPYRLVGILTAIQDNFFPKPDEEYGEQPSPAALVDMFESMHVRSVEIFGSVVSPDIAKRVGLKA